VATAHASGTAIRSTIRGYHGARPSERGAFAILSSFAVSIGAARAINYTRERRRSFPALRDWVRRAYHAPGQEKLRVHHFVPGIGLAFVSGATAILTRDDGLDGWLGVAFGTGAGLTLDEIALLTELDNPYWESATAATA
jgi:hypothetical protein